MTMGPVSTMPARWPRRSIPVRNPIRGLLHGSASFFCLGMAAYFASHPSGSERLDPLLIGFASSHAMLFMVSASYHSLPWREIAKARMQRLDHSMIYVKIAGSIGPLAWLALEEAQAWQFITAGWVVAVLGIAQKAFVPSVDPKLSARAQIVQALLLVPILAGLMERHPGPSSGLVCFTAIVYTLGAVVFLLERPRLWPSVFSFHELFHLLLVIGSASLGALLVGLVYATGA